MINLVVDITRGSCSILRVSQSQGVPVYSSSGSGPLLRVKNLTNDLSQQYDISPRRETYVCSRDRSFTTVASRHWLNSYLLFQDFRTDEHEVPSWLTPL